jgi:hypothetical protein
MAEMMREVAESVSELRVPSTGHWIAEENADGFLHGLLAFLRAPERRQLQSPPRPASARPV